MSKEERMKNQAKLAKAENIALAKQKVEAVGLEHKNEELPDEDVSQNQVRRTLLTSLRTFVPYTNEWYEAKAAEEEMDDYKRIKVERVKAEDIYTMTKMGRHEEALAVMKLETDRDFFFFNKLKYKMEQEGKYKWEGAPKKNAFNELKRSGKRNRLRNAVNAVYDSLDEGTMEELARLSAVGGGIDGGAQRTTVHDRNAPCNWRGRNKNGENLRCENKRMIKPIRADLLLPADVRRLKENPEVLSFCAYHVPMCLGEAHGVNEMVKIKVPNNEGLCAECFMLKHAKKLPPLRPDIVPGVVPITLGALSRKLDDASSSSVDDDGSLDDGTIDSAATKYQSQRNQKMQVFCQWIADPMNEQTRIYECGNHRYVSPVTGHRLKTCAWHNTTCLLSHPPGSNSAITIPNQYGLCTMHHLAEKGHPPPQLPLPYPGMKLKQGKDFWKRRGKHWATPKHQPPPAIQSVSYFEPSPPIDILDKLWRVVKFFLYKRRVRLRGKWAATIIQKNFRSSKIHGAHSNVGYAKRRLDRMIHATRIQAKMRCFLAQKHTRAMRILYNKSALKIQKVYRGHLCRLWLYVDWAARRLAKFMKTLHFHKFKDSVIMVMQLRRLFKKRNALALQIQRVYRGYATRCYIHNLRMLTIVHRTYARKIQRAYRDYLSRKVVVVWEPPSEEWVLENCGKRLAQMILELYLDRSRRMQLAAAYHQAVPGMQRLIRGFLRRAGAKKMKYLRSAMRSWLQPRVATEFLRKYLEQKIFYLRQGSRPATPKVNLISDEKLVRAHLPSEKQDYFEVDYRSFDKALESWYTSVRMPLIQSERDALVRKFKNPMNGNINVRALDAFIFAHKLPCRKHGRFICGDCVYRKNCNVRNCKCAMFKSSTDDGIGICTHCDHPGTLHTLVPLQVKHPFKAGKKNSMLKVLTAVREPDTSLPMAVEGMIADNVIIRPMTPSDHREAAKHDLKQSKQLHQTWQQTSIEQRSIGKSLSLCEIDGDTVHNNKDYWNQYGTSTVKPVEANADDSADTAIFDPITFDNRKPNFDIPANVFWSLTAKNPNKRVRDYHEKFEHNMPVPVVHKDEIVYTFEGPQIYFNLVNMIIRMEKLVDYDNPEFLKLVVDHIQIFERHWRKMVVDIRKGKLDRNLNISQESRDIFEAANLPRPKLANQLDLTFRNLGFHKKVLGKDIVIRVYAEKRPKKREIETVASHHRRKRSLPHSRAGITSSSSGRHLTSSATTLTAVGLDDTAAGGGTLTSRSPSAKLSTPSISRGGSRLAPISSSSASSPSTRSQALALTQEELNSRGMASPAALSGTATGAVSRTGTAARSSRGSNRPRSKREVLAAMSQSFKSVDGASAVTTPSRLSRTHSRDGTTASRSHRSHSHSSHSSSSSSDSYTDDDDADNNDDGQQRLGTSESTRRKRRGSHSDANRPASAMEIDQLHYEQLVAARVKYRHTVEMDGDRYVCPFPACGKSFHSRDAAFRHLPVHEQRTRLYAPTPLPDSHMQFYWPQGVPWFDAPRFAEREIPPGSLPCPIAGCREVFDTRPRLDAHLKAVHMKMDPSSLALGYFTLQGDTVFLPPGPISDYLRCSLRWCPLHALPLGSCPVCIEIESQNMPKPPFKIFSAVTVDFRLKQRRLTKMLGPAIAASAGIGSSSMSTAAMTQLLSRGPITLQKNEPFTGVIVSKQSMHLGSPSQLSKQQIQAQQKKKTNLQRNRRMGGRGGATATAGGGSDTASNSTSTVTDHWHGRPVAMLLDRLDKCWVAVEVLYTHQEALARDLMLSPEFNKRYQLARPLQYAANTIAEVEAAAAEEDEDDDASSRASGSGSRAGSASGSRTGSRLSSRGNKSSKKNVAISSGVVPDPDYYTAPPGTVLRLMSGGEEEMCKYIRWVPLHCIERTFDLVLGTRESMERAVEGSSAVMLRNTCFVVIE